MRSNFESPMKLRNGNGMLEVCGPVGWAPTDPRVVVTVTIRQPADPVTPGSGTIVAQATSVKTFGLPDDEWMFFIRTNGAVPGLADADAQFESPIGTAVGTWTQLVELK
jgi:hypothetical protein